MNLNDWVRVPCNVILKIEILYYTLTKFTSAVFSLVLYSNITINVLVYIASLVVGVATVVLMKCEDREFQGYDIIIDKDQNVCSICLVCFSLFSF